MANSIIVCDSLTGGSVSLEDIKHTDIFNDNTRISITEDDLAFVIIDGGPSYFYKAIYSDTPSSDFPNSVAPLSGGTYEWELQFIADLNADFDFPEPLMIAEGLPPTGYDTVYSFPYFKQLYVSGSSLSIRYPLCHIENNILFMMGAYSYYPYVFKAINLDTGLMATKTNLPSSPYMDMAAGCFCNSASSYYYFIFDTFNNRTIRVYLGQSSTASWTMPTPIPGIPRKAPSCVSHKGEMYIFGGSSSFISAYKYVYDSYEGTETWLQLNDSPATIGIYNSPSFSIGDKIYVFYYSLDYTTCSFAIYDPDLDTWDTTTIPTFSYELADVVGRSSFYRPTNNSIYIFSAINPSPYMSAIRYDISLNTWSIEYETIIKLSYYYNSIIYDSSTDEMIVTMNSYPYILRYKIDKLSICKKQS